MVFSSLTFLTVFLPVTLGVYFLLPRLLRNAWLFFMSLVFYAWGEPVYLFLMLGSTVFNYVIGLLLGKSVTARKRTLLLVVGVVGNLGLLGWFKYASFLMQNLNHLFGFSVSVPTVVLPIGISFYTFQIMSYIIDVYRGKVSSQRNLITFGAYVALFPQLIAGPIVRYSTVEYELSERRETCSEAAQGLARFCCGLGKKVLLANSAGALWDIFKATPTAELSIAGAWLGIFAFAFQIYFDFSGYSDMAIGLGKILGFHFLENFDHPYESKSVSEFWRRWHISLGTWFKEYLYFPLGGSRGGKLRTVFNLLVVWSLTGLWHGANWNFVWWGFYYGVLLVVEKLGFSKLLVRLGPVVGHLYTLFAVLIGWAIFALDQPGTLLPYLGVLFGSGTAINSQFCYQALRYAPQLAVMAIGCTTAPAALFDRLTKKRGWAVTVASMLCLAVCMIYLVDSTYNPFLYFRF